MTYIQIIMLKYTGIYTQIISIILVYQFHELRLYSMYHFSLLGFLFLKKIL